MSHVSDRRVPHEGPLDSPFFFIGEAPGSNEDVALRPFVGQSGDLFNASLSEVGLSREDVRVGNVLNYQPTKNNFALAGMSWQLDESKKELTEYLRTHKHKVLIPMGNKALEFLTGHDSIEKHRGSVYRHATGAYIVPTIHPAAVLRDGSYTPAFLNDLLRAKRIVDDGWIEPTFNFSYPTAEKDNWFEAESILQAIRTAPRLWCDIETRKYTNYIRCVAFAWSKTEAVCVFNDATEGLGPRFSRFIRILLEDVNIKKTFHNGFFDTNILRKNGVLVEGWDFDTMLMQHSLQPELPKGLDYCTSLYSPIQYYKDDGKESSDRLDKTKLAIYNCKDVVATCWTEEGQRAEADDIAWKMFNRKFEQTPLQQELTECGLLIDDVRRKEIEAIVLNKMGVAYSLFFHILSQHDIPESDYFKLSQHKKVQDFLYKTLKLPTKTKQDGSVTADEDAIVDLIGSTKRKLQELKTEKARYPWGLKFAALKLILEIRGYEKLLTSYVRVKVSLDGRARSVYNSTGTETNRWSASNYWDDTGWNGQTIPREGLE